MPKFWKMAKAKEKVGELYLYGEVSSTSWYGDEITPKQFKADLDALGEIDVLNIYINSIGGDVWAGQSIYSMLSRVAAQKNVYIDGIAASIASVIAMAGDKIYMPANALLMIHNAWTITWGNAEQLRKEASVLETVDATIVEVYQKRTDLTKEDIQGLMAAETWMNAEEAVGYGFADEITAEKKAAACLRGDVLVLADGITQDAKRYAAKLAGIVPADGQQKPDAEPPQTAPAEIYEKIQKINGRRQKYV